MKRFLIICLCTMLLQQVIALPIQSDSLIKVLDQTLGKKEQALLYSQLAKSLRFEDSKSAIEYAVKGLALAESLEYPLGVAENAAMLGDIYVMKDNLEEARNFYQRSVGTYQQAGKIFDMTQVQMILGNIDLAQNNYFEALKRYEECLKTSKAEGFNKLMPHLYNNLGGIFLQIEDFEEAAKRYEKSREIFEAENDEYNAAISQYNLSKVEVGRGKVDEAIKGYLNAINILSTLESWPEIANGYNSIAELYQKKGEEQRAQEYLGLALSIIENNQSTFEGPTSLYSTLIYTNVAEQAFKAGDTYRAMDFAHRSLDMAETNQYKSSIAENAELIGRIHEQEARPDSALSYYRVMIQYKDEAQKEENIKRITQLRMQYEFDSMVQKKELEELRSKAVARQRETLIYGVLGFVLLSAAILLLLYRNQKTKADRAILSEQNLELERFQLDQDLEYKNKELATNMMYLLEKNEFITGIARKLSEAKDSFNKSNQGMVQQLIMELKQNSSTKIWEEFEMRFKEVHAEFYAALNDTYPDLTPNEVKLCAFLRLNMSTKEISAITHQSVNSLNMARFRLRKKMGIDRDENLITTIAQL